MDKMDSPTQHHGQSTGGDSVGACLDESRGQIALFSGLAWRLSRCRPRAREIDRQHQLSESMYVFASARPLHRVPGANSPRVPTGSLNTMCISRYVPVGRQSQSWPTSNSVLALVPEWRSNFSNPACFWCEERPHHRKMAVPRVAAKVHCHHSQVSGSSSVIPVRRCAPSTPSKIAVVATASPSCDICKAES